MVKKRIWQPERLLVLLLLLAALAVLTQPAAAGEDRLGQVAVRIDRNVAVARLVTKIGGSLVDSIAALNSYLISFPEELPVDSIVAEIISEAGVVYAHGNRSMELPETFQMSQGFPDQENPIFVEGVSPASYYEQAGIYTTGIDSAQTIATGQDIVVAVIDNGLVFDHPLIAASSTIFPHDFIQPDGNPAEEPGLLYGHGTFVASMVLLTAPDCIIMPLRAFDGDGIGDQFAVAQAITWAANHGAQVINLSSGTESASALLADAVQDALQAGVSLVASSGNDGAEVVSYPASHLLVNAVTSFDTLEVIADFANYGSYLDLCAPGVNLYGALPGECDWGTWSGTSFSAPLVSGTVALVKQLDATLSPPQLQEHLRLSARQELMWGTIAPPDLHYGYGALDAYEAVLSLSVGDLNGNGDRDNEDIVILNDYVSGGSPPPDNSAFYRKADVNCDGIINVADVAKLVQIVRGNKRAFGPCYR